MKRKLKKIRNTMIIAIVFNFLSCVQSINDRRLNENNLIAKARKGNIEAYQELKILYLDYKPIEFIPIAKFMVDSIKYNEANIDIIQKYFETYNKYPDDTLDVTLLKILEREDLKKYYDNAKNKNLSEILKYKIKW